MAIRGKKPRGSSLTELVEGLPASLAVFEGAPKAFKGAWNKNFGEGGRPRSISSSKGTNKYGREVRGSWKIDHEGGSTRLRPQRGSFRRNLQMGGESMLTRKKKNYYQHPRYLDARFTKGFGGWKRVGPLGVLKKKGEKRLAVATVKKKKS